MNNKEFKNIFDEVAKTHDFKKAFSGWYKESQECIAILELQKSSYKDSYYLNIKIFIQGVFERVYLPNKDLIKSPIGHITDQIRDKEILDFTNSMNDDERKEHLIDLFEKYIVPFTNKTLSKSSIKELEKNGQIILLPAIKQQLSV